MSSFTSIAFAFADAFPAGPVFADASHRASFTKTAPVGLCLGLPVHVLHTSFAPSKAAPVGLGIFIPDFQHDDGVSPVSNHVIVSSPPMLAPRRLRAPLPLVDSPNFGEFSPVGASPAPLSGGLPTTDSISSGLNLLCLSDEEMAAYIPPGILDTIDEEGPEEAVYPVGLGLSLADLDGPELVFTLREHGFCLDGDDSNIYCSSSSSSAAMSLSSIDSSATTMSSLASQLVYPPISPPLLPHLTSRYIVQGHVVHPKPRRAQVDMGFNLEDGPDSSEKSCRSPVVVPPTLGFGSPAFWGKLSDVLYSERVSL